MGSYHKNEPIRDNEYGAAAVAMAAGLRSRVSDEGLSGLVGTRMDPSQRFEDFAGELPSRGEVERWCRAARVKLSNDQKSVLRGAVPAKLEMDTEPFDYSSLPALPADAAESTKATRALQLAKYDSDNAKMAKYRAERINEIKAELGEDVAAALERNAQLLLKTLKSSCKIGGSAGDTFDGAPRWHVCTLMFTGQYGRPPCLRSHARARASRPPRVVAA